MLKNYQHEVNVNTLYKINLASASGLGEALKPRICSIGGIVTVYGSELEPTGLTLANLSSKMAVVGVDVGIDSWESLPNFICIVVQTGTVTELVLSSIEIISETVIT